MITFATTGASARVMCAAGYVTYVFRTIVPMGSSCHLTRVCKNDTNEPDAAWHSPSSGSGCPALHAYAGDHLLRYSAGELLWATRHRNAATKSMSSSATTGMPGAPWRQAGAAPAEPTPKARIFSIFPYSYECGENAVYRFERVGARWTLVSGTSSKTSGRIRQS